jgi:branched-subunit amino acid transport protein
MNAWIAVLIAGCGSYAFRFGVIVVIDRFTLPTWFERVSSYVMPAVFAGLAGASFAVPLADGIGSAMPVLAGATATLVVARIRSAALAVLAGMTVLWAVQGAAALWG